MSISNLCLRFSNWQDGSITRASARVLMEADDQGFYSLYGLPSWLSGKEPTWQCRCGSDPWIGKIPWRRKWHPFQYSCLGNLTDRGAWWASLRTGKRWTRLGDYTTTTSSLYSFLLRWVLKTNGQGLCWSMVTLMDVECILPVSVGSQACNSLGARPSSFP